MVQIFLSSLNRISFTVLILTLTFLVVVESYKCQSCANILRRHTHFNKINHKYQITSLRVSNPMLLASSTTSPAQVIPDCEKIDLLFDSECPICMMEVEFLKKRDIEGRIRFSDLSSPDYNPTDHGNVQFADGKLGFEIAYLITITFTIIITIYNHH